MAKLLSVLFVSVLISASDAASGFLLKCDVGTLGYYASSRLLANCGTPKKIFTLDMNYCLENSEGVLWQKRGGMFRISCKNCYFKLNDKFCCTCNVPYDEPMNTCINLDDVIGFKNGMLYC
ncbi:hypothetical protein DSL72_002422 [Monilinia vaccinii-corymbosi]|uniref:Cyanovirin-N domain-containing protein n=1 Tax=Monilinia vaccinii-corymbosi TaxID=61207 RepID=A0A8A3PCH3_9HELO|nr:hypothetical protein DSL72_002422 [Monilinia vaccinii-corymbosi]